MRPFRALAPLALLAALAGPLAAQQAAPVTAATATPSHLAAVRQLMEVTHVRELLDQSRESMLQSQLKQMPQLAPVADILRDFLREQLDWKVLEPEYTQLYLQVFTEQELRDMTKFYQTPLGQKMLSKLPELMAKSSELSMARLQAAMPQLQQRIQAAMEAGANAPTAKADSAKKAAP